MLLTKLHPQPIMYCNSCVCVCTQIVCPMYTIFNRKSDIVNLNNENKFQCILRIFMTDRAQTYQGLSKGKIEFQHDSTWEKWTLHKIPHEKNGPFTKFHMRKTDPSQNPTWEKRTRYKIQYEENGLFTKFNTRKYGHFIKFIIQAWKNIAFPHKCNEKV